MKLSLRRFWNYRKIRIVCFDLDNTLYDYGIAEAEAEAHIASIIARKIKGMTPRSILATFSQIKKNHMHHDIEPGMFSRRLWFSELLRKTGFKEDIESMSRSYEREYWSFLVPRIKLFPKTIETLEFLKRRYKIACITDSDGEKSIKLGRINTLGLDKYFDYIITTDDTGKNKPSIENWEYLLKISGMKAEECMMVGDHPEVDLVNAKKLGFITVWTKEHIFTDIHLRYVDYEIKQIGDILEILRKH